MNFIYDWSDFRKSTSLSLKIQYFHKTEITWDEQLSSLPDFFLMDADDIERFQYVLSHIGRGVPFTFFILAELKSYEIYLQ